MEYFLTPGPGSLGRAASGVDAELQTYVRGFLTPFVPGVLVGLALVVSALASL